MYKQPYIDRTTVYRSLIVYFVNHQVHPLVFQMSSILESLLLTMFHYLVQSILLISTWDRILKFYNVLSTYIGHLCTLTRKCQSLFAIKIKRRRNVRSTEVQLQPSMVGAFPYLSTVFLDPWAKWSTLTSRISIKKLRHFVHMNIRSCHFLILILMYILPLSHIDTNVYDHFLHMKIYTNQFLFNIEHTLS